MKDSEIPAEVREFLLAHVAAVDELEVLLTLIGGGDRWWDARTMGQQVGVSEGRARRTLDRFAAANLLDLRVTEEVRYQLRPGTPAMEDAVRRVTTVYRQQPALLLRFAATLPRRGITDFADAFRLRRT